MWLCQYFPLMSYYYHVLTSNGTFNHVLIALEWWQVTGSGMSISCEENCGYITVSSLFITFLDSVPPQPCVNSEKHGYEPWVTAGSPAWWHDCCLICRWFRIYAMLIGLFPMLCELISIGSMEPKVSIFQYCQVYVSCDLWLKTYMCMSFCCYIQ